MQPDLPIEEHLFADWGALVEFVRSKSDEWQHWIYRGQANSLWDLSTSLERTARRFGVLEDEWPKVENGLLRRFQRQLHHYYSAVPADEHRIEWLALMQHHGAPTRLLDWTYSVYVALFFALEAANVDTECAVWAIDRVQWRKAAVFATSDPEVGGALAADPNAKLPATVDLLLFREPPERLVFPINPFRLHERLVLQQGVFLAPGDVARPFTANLAAVAHQASPVVKIRIQCTKGLLRQAVRDLHRMNLTRATLFPGLDGFAAHLGGLVVDPGLIATDETRDPWAVFE